MYAVEVRDRIMIAHSLPDPFFGPAQNMHGATFVVDVAFFREKLTRQNVVVDIGAALDVLNKTLKPRLPEPGCLPQFRACSRPPSSCAATCSTPWLRRRRRCAGRDGKARQDPRHPARDDLARLVRGAGVGMGAAWHHRCAHDPRSSPFPATSGCRRAATCTTAACWRCCRSLASRRAICSCRHRFPIRAQPISTNPDGCSRQLRPATSSSLTGWPMAPCRPRSSSARARQSCTVHHPLCLEPGLPRRGRMRCIPWRKRRWRWQGGSSSPATRPGGRWSRISRARDQVTVAEPGTDPRRARGLGSRTARLLSVGAIVPRKAYDILVRALGP